MAEIRRTRDHSIWFNSGNFRETSDEPLLETLSALSGGQQIDLLLNGARGVWVRYHGGQLALRPADESALESWAATADLWGEWFSIALPSQGLSSPPINAEKLLPRLGPPQRRTDRTAQTQTIPILPTKPYTRTNRAVLCIGLDLAWWGGSLGVPESQNDALSYMVLGGDPGTLEICRVPLATQPNPNRDEFTSNCDPAANATVEALKDVIEAHTASQIVLAVDAPLIAAPRDLPRRSKISRPGMLARREPEQALDAAMRAGPAAWRSCCHIQPGAPVCSRVEALVDELTKRLGFQLYNHNCRDTPERSLVECFPSEAIWALGCLSHYPPITPKEARAYKGFSSDWHPIPTVMHAVYLHVVGFISALGVPGSWVRLWAAQLASAILTDPKMNDASAKCVRGGKLFDDVIDSVNALFTAVSFCHDTSHVWIGPDLSDGHIVGPGRFPTAT